MHKKIYILDCTLRDGAYITESMFGEKTLRGVINNLTKANIDMIEVGWLKNLDYSKGSSWYNKPEDIIQYLPNEKKSNQSYIAMIDYGRYDISQLKDYDGKSIDTIRLVFPKEKFEEAIEFSKIIKQKGYNLCLQAANTPSYSDFELLKLIKKVNEVTPQALSIVDTFGIMYPNDLRHIFEIFDKNLHKDIKIGFHSHNNLQMSFALAIDFMNYITERDLIIDSSLVGMGRGAGNTCTELVTNYLNKYNHSNYDLDMVMDTIDIYMTNLISKYNWGYSIPYCIAGQLGSHVNNIAYLQNTHKTNYKDMKLILESMPINERKLYNYDNLEQAYISYQDKKIDDSQSYEKLFELLNNKEILLLSPGKSLKTQSDKIKDCINKIQPIIMGVNHIPENYNVDFLFFSNPVRYNYAKTSNRNKFDNLKKIITSNIKTEICDKEYLINYSLIAKFGWKYFDNSTIMLIRLLDKIGVKSINIAGFDGYDETGDVSYQDSILQATITMEDCKELNANIQSMLDDFFKSHKNANLHFITQSRFNKVIAL